MRLLGWLCRMVVAFLGEMGGVWMRGSRMMVGGAVESTTVGEAALEAAGEVTDGS
jgi:hypothetical protein